MTRQSAAVLRFEPYEALSARSGWERSLGNTEEPLAVAAGSSFVAVATDAHNLHVFSSGGVHLTTLSLAGPPVAVAAMGGLLVATWHRCAPTVAGDQCLDYMVRCFWLDAEQAVQACSLQS
jgi:Minichromosome loss protein, Mcl1, middle region